MSEKVNLSEIVFRGDLRLAEERALSAARRDASRPERDAEYERVRALAPAYEARLRANPQLRGGVLKPRVSARRTARAEPRVREVDFGVLPPDDLPRELWPEFFR